MAKNINIYFQPRLIIGQPSDELISKLLSELKITISIDSPDFFRLKPEKEFSIADSRLLIKKSSLSPLFSDFKVILAENFTSASVAAQNSLLKILEEPPVSTLIILQSETKNHILPTVLSRIITIGATPPKLSQVEIDKAAEIISHITSDKLLLGQKLILIDSFKEAELKILVRAMLAVLNHHNLNHFEVFLAKSLLDINNLTKINIRLRLALDNLIIALDQLIKKPIK